MVVKIELKKKHLISLTKILSLQERVNLKYSFQLPVYYYYFSTPAFQFLSFCKLMYTICLKGVQHISKWA